MIHDYYLNDMLYRTELMVEYVRFTGLDSIKQLFVWDNLGSSVFHITSSPLFIHILLFLFVVGYIGGIRGCLLIVAWFMGVLKGFLGIVLGWNPSVSDFFVYFFVKSMYWVVIYHILWFAFCQLPYIVVIKSFIYIKCIYYTGVIRC